jgi:hypothetical protein
VQIPLRVLERMRAGEVTLAFRRWGRPRAKAGGRQRTALGVLAIDSVERVPRSSIRAEDARLAGYSSLRELLAHLDSSPRREAPIWRIELHWAGQDPRVALRERVDLSSEELSALTARLDRMDEASSHGPWTRETLALIAERPEVLAADLASSLGRERLPFKRDVRKLKELGLTESLRPGYRLSPRGRALMEAEAREPPAPG